MAAKETYITNRIRVFLSSIGVITYRNNRGLFKTLDGKRKVRAGLEVNGSCDLIGYTPVKITEDMVGDTVAVFTAAEIKTKTGTASADQKDFINRVNSRGGIAFIARSEADAIKAFHGYSIVG